MSVGLISDGTFLHGRFSLVKCTSFVSIETTRTSISLAFFRCHPLLNQCIQTGGTFCC